MINIEICINADNEQHVQHSVNAALAGGASTVELCAEMVFDGLSPKREYIALARKIFAQKSGLMVMIRPRKGDFCYSRQELYRMHVQIEAAAKEGSDGVVLGVLDVNQKIDEKALRALAGTCKNVGQSLTFHRAIDAVSNQVSALEVLIDCGVDRVLTSGVPWGQQGSALDGISQLQQLLKAAQNRIEIVIAGGIGEKNVSCVLQQLPHDCANISVHAYSSVLEGGLTNVQKVSALYDAVIR